MTSGVANFLDSGTYTASEANLPGYAAGTWVGECTSEGVITLGENEQKVCEITNTWEPPPGDQGCTPGYWKYHPDSWPPTGYATGQPVQSVFPAASAYPQGDATLLEAFDFGGGTGVEGAVQVLLGAAVAGVLNAAHDGVSSARSEAALTADVDAALAAGDRDVMLGLAAGIDLDNNAGCPLS